MRVQKSGVIIGCRVAPRLSHIFLAKVDRTTERLVKAPTKIFRSVNDYLVFVNKKDFSQTIHLLLNASMEQGLYLRSTFETPNDQTTHFFL